MAIKRFEVTEDHLKLLRRAYVSWWDCEFGAPCIDCKRPYGNSDVLEDMAEILEIEMFEDAYGEKHFHKGQPEYLATLHKELQTVLQIALQTGTFQAGWYRNLSDYGEEWTSE